MQGNDNDDSIEKEIMDVDANVNESSNIMMPFSLNQTHADMIEHNQSANNSESASMRILKEEFQNQGATQQNDMMLFKATDTGNNSMDGLERQIMAATSNQDSPDQAYKKMEEDGKAGELDFYAQDSQLIGTDSQALMEDTDNKVYDAIISKLISDPRIDKKTLIQRFIAKGKIS